MQGAHGLTVVAVGVQAGAVLCKGVSVVRKYALDSLQGLTPLLGDDMSNPVAAQGLALCNTGKPQSRTKKPC